MFMHNSRKEDDNLEAPHFIKDKSFGWKKIIIIK